MLAVALLAANLASTAFSSSSSGEITGCVNKIGALRVVDRATECDPAAGESALIWNQAGPAGPAGVTGAAGPAGNLPQAAVGEIGLDLKTARSKIAKLDKQRLSLDELSDSDSLGLQSAMDRMSKFMQTISNILKKLDDSSNSIVENLK